MNNNNPYSSPTAKLFKKGKSKKIKPRSKSLMYAGWFQIACGPFILLIAIRDIALFGANLPRMAFISFGVFSTILGGLSLTKYYQSRKHFYKNHQDDEYETHQV